MIEGFDPYFDDATWTLDWLRLPLAQVPEGEYEDGYRVTRREVEDIEVFGQAYHFDPPLDVRVLFDPDGTLWMSDTPQERMMMYNNARQSWGRVLVGGAGLCLYPQYLTQVETITIVERSPLVLRLVAPLLKPVMDQRRITQRFLLGDVHTYLQKAEPGRYDTIFLDTWPQLDATLLPAINRMREDAARHLAPGGQVLAWGYRWMVRLFEEACATLLLMPSDERTSWLAENLQQGSRAAALLEPVARSFQGETIQRWELDAAVAECRAWVVEVRAS